MKTCKYKYYKCEEDDIVNYFKGSGDHIEYFYNGSWTISPWTIEDLNKMKGPLIIEISPEEWVLLNGL